MACSRFGETLFTRGLNCPEPALELGQGTRCRAQCAVRGGATVRHPHPILIRGVPRPSARSALCRGRHGAALGGLLAVPPRLEGSWRRSWRAPERAGRAHSITGRNNMQIVQPGRCEGMNGPAPTLRSGSQSDKPTSQHTSRVKKQK